MRTKGFWWVIDGNKRNLMRIVWELGENNRILMGYWWEQEEFDGNFLGTWWEIKSLPLQKDKKHPLGACLHHPIGSPLQKLRNILGGMLVPNDANKWVGSHEQDKIFENIPCHVMEYYIYIHLPCGKFQVTWQNILWHVIKYYATSPKYFLESTKVYWL
jgi:hypothetical protein